MLPVERLQDILDKQLLWISAADSRLALVLPLSTAMLGALAATAPKLTEWTLAGGIPASLAVLFLVLAIAFCSLAAFPRTHGPAGSIIFFEGIASRDLEKYRAQIDTADDAHYANDLIQQCHINAAIASAKFVWVKRSMRCLMLASIPWAIAIYVFYRS